MATLEELVVQLTADTASLRTELQTAQKVVQGSTDKMEKAIKDFSENSNKNIGFFETAVATMSGFLASQAVTGAMNVLKDAVAGLANELMEAGAEAIKEETAFNLLASSLARTGHYSKEAADDLIDFTAEMESLAQVSQDVIASNVAMLSSLTRLDVDGLKRAELAAINMSAALGTDLSSATSAVAKAINGNEGALGRLGIKLDLTSDSARNFEIVTAALNERFGAAAQAKINTFAGSLFILKDAYGDMMKEIARTVTSNEVFITVMQGVADAFKNLETWIKNNQVAIRDGLGKALIELLGVTESALNGMAYLFKYLNYEYAKFMLPLREGIELVKMLGNTFTFQIGDAVKNVDNMINLVGDLNKKFDAMNEKNSFNMIADAVGTIKDKAQGTFDGMVGSAVEAANAQENLGGAVAMTTTEMTKQQEALKGFVEGLAAQSMAIDSQYKLNQQMLAEGLAQDLITQQEYFAELTEMRDAERELELQKIQEAEDAKLVTQQQANAARLALNQNYALETQKQLTQMKAYEEKIAKERLQGYGTFFGGLAALSESSNRELAAIGKAAAISKATIDAYLAIQNALANVPFPANIAASVGIGVQAFSNVAKIAGVGLAGGISEVPMSARGGNNGDNFPAILKPKERVLTADQNKDFTDMLKNGGGMGGRIDLNITVLPGTGLNSDQIGDLIEQFNRYMQAGGLKLIPGMG